MHVQARDARFARKAGVRRARDESRYSQLVSCCRAGLADASAGLPGVSDPHVDVAPLDAVGGNLDDTHSYAPQASYEQNLK